MLKSNEALDNPKSIIGSVENISKIFNIIFIQKFCFLNLFKIENMGQNS